MSNLTKNIIIITFVTILFSPEFLYSKNDIQHGGIVKIFYAPFGYGSVIVPYKEAISGKIDTKMAQSGEGDYLLSNLTCYKITAGYFYGYFQGEFSYFASFFRDMDLMTTADEVFKTIKGEYSFFDLKAGIRINEPGDSSYNWFYLGFKRMVFESGFNTTEVIGYGILMGFSGFHSYGVKSDFEFILTYDFSFGAFQQLTISSDIHLKSQDEFTLIPGVSLGLGVQYEPYNLSFLLKMSPEFLYSIKVDNSSSVGVGMLGFFIGFEVIAHIPSYKFNKR